jgi:cytochrome c oxidase subunit 2
VIFHDLVFIVIIFTITIVLSILIFIAYNKNVNLRLAENQTIEWIWTITPAIILLLIAIPSITLLYIYDEHINYRIRIKTIGHQWFWSYEIIKIIDGKIVPLSFDSYIIPTNELPTDGFRLLDTDSHLVLPINTPIQLLVTSDDVLHSWTIPALGVKVDAVPGRLNLLSLYSYQPGIFFGQCSEICGANHRFIPIVVEFINTIDYVSWLVSNLSIKKFQTSFGAWTHFYNENIMWNTSKKCRLYSTHLQLHKLKFFLN